MPKSCIFCRIIAGEVKAYTVYEDRDTVAFLDIAQFSRGHTLIMPKKHYADLYDMPEAQLRKILVVAKKLALTYRKRLDARSANLLHASGKDAEQSVFHFHMHLVPRYPDDGLESLWFRREGAPKLDIERVFNEIKGK